MEYTPAEKRKIKRSVSKSHKFSCAIRRRIPSEEAFLTVYFKQHVQYLQRSFRDDFPVPDTNRTRIRNLIETDTQGTKWTGVIERR